jgi:hypothetical protein
VGTELRSGEVKFTGRKVRRGKNGKNILDEKVGRDADKSQKENYDINKILLKAYRHAKVYINSCLQNLNELRIYSDVDFMTPG